MTDYKQAVELAERVQPRDQGLLAALDALGNNLLGQDKAAAQAAFEREFRAATGPPRPAVDVRGCDPAIAGSGCGVAERLCHR